MQQQEQQQQQPQRVLLTTQMRNQARSHYYANPKLTHEMMADWCAREFGRGRPARSTISQILRTPLQDCVSPDTMRLRRGAHPEMEAELFAEIAAQAVGQGVDLEALMVDGTLAVEELVARANRILKRKREDDKVTAAWVPRFKKRFNLLSSQSTMSVTDGINLDPEQEPAIPDGVGHGQGKRGEVEVTPVEHGISDRVDHGQGKRGEVEATPAVQGIGFVVELQQLGQETEKLKTQQMEFQSTIQQHTSVLDMMIEEHQLDMAAFELKMEEQGLDKDGVKMKNAQHQQETAALKMKIEGHHQDLCVLKMQFGQQSRDVTSLVAQHKHSMRAVEAFQNQHAQHTMALKHTVAMLQQDFAALQQQHVQAAMVLQQDMATLQQQHAQAARVLQQDIAALQQQHAQETMVFKRDIATLQQQHAQETKALKQDIAGLQQHHAQETKALKQDIAVLQQQHAQETKALKQDIAGLQQQHAQDIATFKKSYVLQAQDIATIKKSLVLQAQEMSTMKELHKKANSSLSGTESAIEDVRNELKKKDKILLGIRDVVNALIQSKKASNKSKKPEDRSAPAKTFTASTAPGLLEFKSRKDGENP